MNFWKFLVLAVVVIFGGLFLFGVVMNLLQAILGVAIPVLVVLVIAYLVYRWATRDSRALPGSNRSLR
ncbi:MAG: hypothetical protein MUC92_02720 [Fimbriimonadaceae bacterium]|jgi:uncharacterized membrane protein|nr:hypothetical protein [Fimbriimonadaceae bacterium]